MMSIIDLTRYRLIHKLKMHGYSITDIYKKGGISKLNPTFLTKPEGGLAVCIFPILDIFDFIEWKRQFTQNLRALVNKFKKLIKTGAKLELHLVVGNPGIKLPDWFLREINTLGIAIIFHKHNDLPFPEELLESIDFNQHSDLYAFNYRD